MAVDAAVYAKVAEQIGRAPRGLVAVPVMAADGQPVVVQMRALVEDRPFPTLYWLTCPRLCKQIGQLETQGWVKQLEARLGQDAKLRQAYLADQARYVATRWQLMTVQDRARIAQLGFTEMFERYGIGGIAQWDKIRCLHMQYAHHLAQYNVIGTLLEQELGIEPPMLSKVQGQT